MRLTTSLNSYRLILNTLLIATLAGCDAKSAPSAAAPPPAQPVSAVVLQARDIILTSELNGRVSAALSAEVRPQVDGIIKQRLFTEGSRVEQGQTLYLLDDSLYRANQQQAQAALTRSQAALQAAQLTAQRSAELARRGAMSAQENDIIQAQLKQAQADVALAHANLDAATTTLDYSRITAPISGIIGRSYVTVGALVDAKQDQALAHIQAIDQVYIDLSQSSQELLALRRATAEGKLHADADLNVRILLEDGSNYPLLGQLAFSEISINPSTGSYILRVVLANPDRLLLPGMYVRAEVETGIRKDALLIPQQAVIRDPKGNASIWRIDQHNRAQRQPVELGRTIGGDWLIESGLAPGDRIITEGLQKLRPDSVVEITTGSATAALDTH